MKRLEISVPCLKNLSLALLLSLVMYVKLLEKKITMRRPPRKDVIKNKNEEVRICAEHATSISMDHNNHVGEDHVCFLVYKLSAVLHWTE